MNKRPEVPASDNDIWYWRRNTHVCPADHVGSGPIETLEGGVFKNLVW